MPPSNFTVARVKEAVGENRMIDVVDVSDQTGKSMTMEEFCEYYETSRHGKLYNVLSLEFSQTKLETMVQSPSLVRQLDLVGVAWPQYLKQAQREQTNRIEGMKYPKVQKYCLMSVAGCWTDFHVDFGGTSVWYHIIRGEKIFFLIPPTEENLSAFEQWTLSGCQEATFLGDLANYQKITLQPGWTFFLPCGWIHAVYTPKNSLVFGGNFIHSFQWPMQLRVMELENRIHVPMKQRFPFLQKLCWYSIVRYMQILTGQNHLKPVTNSEMIQLFNAELDPNQWNVADITPQFNTIKVNLTEREFYGLRELANYLSNYCNLPLSPLFIFLCSDNTCFKANSA